MYAPDGGGDAGGLKSPQYLDHTTCGIDGEIGGTDLFDAFAFHWVSTSDTLNLEYRTSPGGTLTNLHVALYYLGGNTPIFSDDSFSPGDTAHWVGLSQRDYVFTVATDSGVDPVYAFDFVDGAGEYLTTGAPTGHAPEPATLALLTLGLAGLGFSRRKQ
jgi:hypothetical protein